MVRKPNNLASRAHFHYASRKNLKEIQ